MSRLDRPVLRPRSRVSLAGQWCGSGADVTTVGKGSVAKGQTPAKANACNSSSFRSHSTAILSVAPATVSFPDKGLNPEIRLHVLSGRISTAFTVNSSVPGPPGGGEGTVAEDAPPAVAGQDGSSRWQGLRVGG